MQKDFKCYARLIATVTNRDFASYREAGHALVALFSKIIVERVSLDSCQTLNMETDCELVRSLLAGSLAHRRAFPKSSDKSAFEGGHKDFEQAYKIAQRASPGGEMTWLMTQQRAANEILHERWNLVDALAMALLSRHELDFREIMEVLEAAGGVR